VAKAVVPLSPSRFTPEFRVRGRWVLLQPMEIASVPVGVLKEHVGSLKEHGQEIMDALDELLTRAFG